MNKNESKYFHTALLMDEALTSLLAEKDFEFITVKEICDRAGVNRSTFYLHYETVSDLLNEAVEQTLKTFLDGYQKNPNEFVPKIQTAELQNLMFINEEYLKPYLTFIREHKNVYRAAFRNPAAMETRKQMDDVSRYVLMPVMHRFEIPEAEQPYWIAFYIRGCMAIVQEWLNRDCSDSVEDIMRIMMACIRPDIKAETYEKLFYQTIS